jgi:hypothetical protein
VCVAEYLAARRRNEYQESFVWDSKADRLVPVNCTDAAMRAWGSDDQIITFPVGSVVEVQEKDGSRATPCNIQSNEWMKGQTCGIGCPHRDGFGNKRPILIREHVCSLSLTIERAEPNVSDTFPGSQIRKCTSLSSQDPLKVLCVLQLAAHNRCAGLFLLCDWLVARQMGLLILHIASAGHRVRSV